MGLWPRPRFLGRLHVPCGLRVGQSPPGLPGAFRRRAPAAHMEGWEAWEASPPTWPPSCGREKFPAKGDFVSQSRQAAQRQLWVTG